MSPFCPPVGFPPHLAVFWPLIWVQILMARAWVRATYGKGTLYRWSVTPRGRVVILSIDWKAGDETPPPELALRAVRAQSRIAAATNSECTCESMEPPVLSAGYFRRLPDSFRSLFGPFTASSGLPRPET